MNIPMQPKIATEPIKVYKSLLKSGKSPCQLFEWERGYYYS